MALLTARRGCPGLSQAEILDGHPPGDVLDALVTVTDTLLDARLPDGTSRQLLEDLGLLAAAQDLPGTP